MARTPRPVNPEEGPVQAFAHDLRELREAAGNPTYRALAKTAGFSATTLGDAAGGVRLPTLEVALAYVGACGGDAEAWRIRWQELNRRLAVERGRAESAGEPGNEPADEPSGSAAAQAGAVERAAEAGDDDLDDLSESRPETAAVPEPADRIDAPDEVGIRPGEPVSGRRRLRRRVLTAAAVLVLGGSLLVWRLPAMDHKTVAPALAAATQTSSVPPTQCPVYPKGSGAFSGSTYSGQVTHVRAGASTAAAVRGEIPSGCTLEFTGYCIGEVVMSGYSGSPDMRWLELVGGGLVASAVIHGDPPAGMPADSCPDDVQPPAAIALTVAADSNSVTTVDLHATGKLVWIVGFAAYYPGAPGESSQWHQLSITSQGTPYFKADLPMNATSGQSYTADVPVIASACLGGQAPTGVDAIGQVDPAKPLVLQPATLQPADLAAAEQMACRYPSTN